MGLELYEKQDYHAIDSELSDGATNESISMGDLSVAVDIIIYNDSQSDFTVKFNGTLGTQYTAHTIAGGETLTLRGVSIRSIYFTNRSGGGIDYRVLMWGR